jgi:phosphatidylglycerophosphate synthase
MASIACILGDHPLRLWGLSSRERLERQLRAAGFSDITVDPHQASAAHKVVIVHAAYLFEQRTISALAKQQDALLECPLDNGLAGAACSGARVLEFAAALSSNDATRAAGARVVRPLELEPYDDKLRRVEAPLLEPMHEDKRQALESLLYGNAYKGITDLVTKWLWPRPARKVVGWCANAGITPNMVTVTGLALVLAACWLFAEGFFVSGLVCGWIMTLLDTVDGKLARVTVQSSKLGHWLDHGMDIIHPPFWYVLWGSGLAAAVAPDIKHLMVQLIVGGYLAGRGLEALFHALGTCSLFAWRPFDAYFRLITARRNPCLIIMTLAMLVGRADWAFYGVALWTAGSSAVMALRLIYAVSERLRHGPLRSWLTNPAAATLHAQAYRTFAGTRGAYG